MTNEEIYTALILAAAKLFGATKAADVAAHDKLWDALEALEPVMNPEEPQACECEIDWDCGCGNMQNHHNKIAAGFNEPF